MPQVDLAEYLRASRRILVFTGAGISTGSGIADFRGPQGVWTRRQPVYYEDFMTSEAARIEHWDYKLEAWESFRNAQPNDVHRAIVRLEQAEKLRMVVTQNIDGLHSLAGTSAERLVELHGTNSLVECQSCKSRSDPEPHFDFFRAQRTPPLCACGGFLKPATISFGQSLEPHELGRARPRRDGSGPGRGARLHPVGLPCGFVSFAGGAARNSLRHRQSRCDGARRRAVRFAPARGRSKRHFPAGGGGGLVANWKLRESARLLIHSSCAYLCASRPICARFERVLFLRSLGWIWLSLGLSAFSAEAAEREFRGAWVATVYNLDWPSRPGLPAATQKAQLRALLDRAARA